MNAIKIDSNLDQLRLKSNANRLSSDKSDLLLHQQLASTGANSTLSLGAAPLEDFIEEIQQRTANESIQPEQVDNSVEAQLAAKDRDLILAAELGKALLERNEQLTLANERITEDYSHKLEILEQEKHALRRKLDSMEGEYESRVLELQSDLEHVRQKLLEQQNSLRQGELEKGRMLQELIEQNHRLTAELKQSCESEEQLNNQIQSMREQFHARRSNLHDHVAQLEGLREEIDVLNKRKSDLEKRLQLLMTEREQLQQALEEAAQRVLQLEQRCAHHAAEAQRAIKELELQRRLCSSEHKSGSSQFNQTNAHNTSTGSSCSSGCHSANSSCCGSSTGGQPTSLFNEMMETDDLINSSHKHANPTDLSSDGDEIECDISSPDDLSNDQWRASNELFAMYECVRHVLADVLRRREERHSVGPNSAQDSGLSSTSPSNEPHLSPTLLRQMRNELRQTVSELLVELDEGPCGACHHLLSERNELIRLRKDQQSQAEQLRRANERASELEARLSVAEVELAAVREERQNLLESATSGTLGKDEIVRRAFELRDQAVARKNVAEVELAKSRVENMHVHSQLIEAVQQKIELSQQLEQFQMDLHSLLDERLRNQLSHQEKQQARKRSANSTPANNSKSPSHSAASLLFSTGKLNKTNLFRLFRSNAQSNNDTNSSNSSVEANPSVLTSTPNSTANRKDFNSESKQPIQASKDALIANQSSPAPQVTVN